MQQAEIEDRRARAHKKLALYREIKAMHALPLKQHESVDALFDAALRHGDPGTEPPSVEVSVARAKTSDKRVLEHA